MAFDDYSLRTRIATALALVGLGSVGASKAIDYSAEFKAELDRGNAAALSSLGADEKTISIQEESAVKDFNEEIQWATGKGKDWLEARGLTNASIEKSIAKISAMTPAEKGVWKNQASADDYIKDKIIPFSLLRDLQEKEQKWYQPESRLNEFVEKLRNSSQGKQYQTLHFLKWNNLQEYKLIEPLSQQAAVIASREPKAAIREANFLKECLKLSRFYSVADIDESDMARAAQQRQTIAQRLSRP